jgi:HEAT repeat protein
LGQTGSKLGKLRDSRAIEALSRIVEGRSQEDSGIREAAASALIDLDDDRIELPLLKYYQASSKDEILKKLIARLIGKSKGV